MKKYVFWYHYNKPLSQSKKCPMISVHYRGTCHYCKELVCNVKTRSKVNKRQPRFVMRGQCKSFKVSGETITIC